MAPNDELAFQRRLLEQWLLSEDSRSTAARLVVKYAIPFDAGDLVNEVYTRIVASLERRSEPLPVMESVQDAAKYGFRTMDNLCRDLRRSNVRRGEVVSVDEDSRQLAVDGGFDRVEQRVFLERLLYAVSAAIEQRPTCAGCGKGMAEAAALQAVHLLLAGDDGVETGRPWLDQLLYRALEIVDPEHVGRTSEAQRQRKLRCGRCARSILTDALSAMGWSK